MWGMITGQIERHLFKGLCLSQSSWLFVLDAVIIEKSTEICENGEVGENSVALWKRPQIHKVEIGADLSESGLDVWSKRRIEYGAG